MTAAWVPDGVEWSALNREMRSRNLVLAGGQDRLSGKIMRIGHLGDVTVEDVVRAIEVIAQSAAAVGMDVDAQAAVRAAREAGELDRAAVASGA